MIKLPDHRIDLFDDEAPRKAFPVTVPLPHHTQDVHTRSAFCWRPVLAVHFELRLYCWSVIFSVDDQSVAT